MREKWILKLKRKVKSKENGTRYSGNMKNFEKFKSKNNMNRRREEIQVKTTGSIFDKIIKENFPNLKEMPVRVQEQTEHQID